MILPLVLARTRWPPAGGHRPAVALVGPFLVFAGTMHFLRPRMYEAIMPPYLPAHRTLVYVSGVAELAGGAGLIAPQVKLRRWAGWLSIATLVGVFPANVHMYMHAEDYPQLPGGKAALAARLPLQAALIAWVRARMNA